MSSELQLKGKELREKSIAEELELEERKALIPNLLRDSDHKDLGSFVAAHTVEKKSLVARGSFEQDQRERLADVTLTLRAAGELLLDQMTDIATAPGSSWAEVGIPLDAATETPTEAEQPVVTEYVYSTALGDPNRKY